MQRPVVAIGNFDGIHVGHQKILSLADTLLTFEPYPQEFFHPENSLPRLTTLPEKKSLFNNIYALDFNEALSLYSPQQFIKEILINQLNASRVIVGEDFRFGRQREGDVNFLSTYIPTEIVSPVLYENRRISSTWVREVLQIGDLVTAKQLLNHDYFMMGEVVKGNQRGRQLGFPTANISLDNRVPPLWGVYAVKINKKYYGVANMGSRPTVDGKRNFLEVYIFDFDQDIYGHMLKVEFIHKIRDEKRFDSLEDLKKQILCDVEVGKLHFYDMLKTKI